MKTLIYCAPAHHVLLEGGERIFGGSQFETTDERALELLTDPQLSVTEADPEQPAAAEVNTEPPTAPDEPEEPGAESQTDDTQSAADTGEGQPDLQEA